MLLCGLTMGGVPDLHECRIALVLLIVNGIIPHTSCTFPFTTGYEPGDLPKAHLLSESFKQDEIDQAISINLIAQVTKILSIKRAIEPSRRHKAIQFKQESAETKSSGEKRQKQAKTKSDPMIHDFLAFQTPLSLNSAAAI